MMDLNNMEKSFFGEEDLFNKPIFKKSDFIDDSVFDLERFKHAFEL